ncbi:MAG: family 10 glycosylhydrolase, partial [Pseudanabaena sp. LacPavin_0818_WC45_MAG_42_6]|nr:family 10 glycosylhydrolase [Pseudanabaena sp. LacPavin_0818_WC45_MAG_42_6]
MMINFPFWAIAQPLSMDTASNNIDQSPSNQVDQSAPPNLPLIRPLNGNELRGIWLTNVDSNVLFSAQNLERAIKRLKRLKFNTLYPTVWNRGYTLYPSKVAETSFGVPVFPIPELQERDMLAEAIKFGHEQNFAVIPWFEY